MRLSTPANRNQGLAVFETGSVFFTGLQSVLHRLWNEFQKIENSRFAIIANQWSGEYFRLVNDSLASLTRLIAIRSSTGPKSAGIIRCQAINALCKRVISCTRFCVILAGAARFLFYLDQLSNHRVEFQSRHYCKVFPASPPHGKIGKKFQRFLKVSLAIWRSSPK